MDRNITVIYKEAQALNLPCTYNEEAGVFHITLAKKRYYFMHGVSPLNLGGSFYIANHKYRLNKLLQRAGFPVAKCTAFSKKRWLSQPLNQLINDLTYPLVAKPMIDTARGIDVLCNIKDEQALSHYLNLYFDKKKYVQIEEFHTQLNEYRVLILNNRVIGVLARTPAYVIGDGIHTVEELIQIRNVERIRLRSTLTISPLTIDLECHNCLEEQNLNLNSVVAAGEKIRLSYAVNTGRGGDIYSMGTTIHPMNAKLLCKATQAIGLNLVGYDVLCEDITQSFEHKKWIIIEANPYPDNTLHELANHGAPQRVVHKILKQLIYRHPLSYLYHVCMHSKISIYFKGGMMVLALLLIKMLLD